MLSKKSIAVLTKLKKNYLDGMYTGICERQTEIALVNPFLSALGWDPCDMTQVHVQEIIRRAPDKLVPDYALFVDGEIKVIMEVKKVGEPLNKPEYIQQVHDYFGEVSSADVVILTDGIKYWFFSYVGFNAPIMNDVPFATIDLATIDVKKSDSFIELFDREAFVSRFTKYLSTADYIRERYSELECSMKRKDRRKAKKSFFEDAKKLKLTVKGEDKPISRAQTKLLYVFTSCHSRHAFTVSGCDTHKSNIL